MLPFILDNGTIVPKRWINASYLDDLFSRGQIFAIGIFKYFAWTNFRKCQV